MFRVHTPIIRSIRRWVAAYGFLHRVFGWVRCGCCRATRPTQRLSRPPPIQKFGAENHMLQLKVWCSWWWAYVPETCRAKNTLKKLPCCIKLAFQIIQCVTGTLLKRVNDHILPCKKVTLFCDLTSCHLVDIQQCCAGMLRSRYTSEVKKARSYSPHPLYIHMS